MILLLTVSAICFIVPLLAMGYVLCQGVNAFRQWWRGRLRPLPRKQRDELLRRAVEAYKTRIEELERDLEVSREVAVEAIMERDKRIEELGTIGAEWFDKCVSAHNEIDRLQETIQLLQDALAEYDTPPDTLSGKLELITSDADKALMVALYKSAKRFAADDNQPAYETLREAFLTLAKQLMAVKEARSNTNAAKLSRTDSPSPITRDT